MKKSSHKVEDGKMVKIEVIAEDKSVKDVNIRGDFFLEPPEKLEALEDKIKGLNINSTVEKVSGELKTVEAELIGFSHEDIGKAFRKAVENSSEDE